MTTARNSKQQLSSRHRRTWLAVFGIGAGLLVLAVYALGWEWQNILWGVAIAGLLTGAFDVVFAVWNGSHNDDDKADT